MKRRKENKPSRTFFLLSVIVILVLLSVGISAYFFFSKPMETKILEVSFEVVPNTLGVDLNSSALTFGRVFPGAVISRTVSLVNSYDYPINVRVFTSDNLKDILFSGKPEFIIGPGEKEAITFTLKIPEEASFGSYSGKVLFEFRKA